MMKLVVVGLLSVILAVDAFAQRPLARLAPRTAESLAKFGQVVGIGGDNVFALARRDPADMRRDAAVIKVFERRTDSEWPLVQTLVAPDSAYERGFRDYAVAGDFLAADAGTVFFYRRDESAWTMIDPPVHPSGQYVAIQYLDEEYMVLTRYVEGSDSPQINDVFARNGSGWEAAGSLRDWSYRMCIAGGDAIQSVHIRAPVQDPVTGETRNRKMDALLISRRDGGVWSVTDTLFVPGGEVDHLECKNETVVYTGDVVPAEPGMPPVDHVLWFASRGSDGKWFVDDEIDVTESGSGIMSLELSDDHLFAGREFKVPDTTKSLGYVVMSEIQVYARSQGEWEYVRTIEHPDPFDRTWQDNDGCIGFDIEAEGGYIVTSAPIRNVKVGALRRSQVGEVLIYAHADLAGLVLAAQELPRHNITVSSVYPNPVHGSSRIEYALASRGTVRAVVFDVVGRRVATLDPGVRGAGSHELVLDTREWSPGVYFLRLIVNDGVPSVRSFVVAA